MFFYVSFQVIPNRTTTIDDVVSSGPKDTLIALIVIIGVLMALFVVVIFAVRRGLLKSQYMRFSSYNDTAEAEEIYDTVNENTVCIPLYSFCLQYKFSYLHSEVYKTPFKIKIIFFYLKSICKWKVRLVCNFRSLLHHSCWHHLLLSLFCIKCQSLAILCFA